MGKGSDESKSKRRDKGKRKEQVERDGLPPPLQPPTDGIMVVVQLPTLVEYLVHLSPSETLQEVALRLYDSVDGWYLSEFTFCIDREEPLAEIPVDYRSFFANIHADHPETVQFGEGTLRYEPVEPLIRWEDLGQVCHVQKLAPFTLIKMQFKGYTDSTMRNHITKTLDVITSRLADTPLTVPVYSVLRIPSPPEDSRLLAACHCPSATLELKELYSESPQGAETVITRNITDPELLRKKRKGEKEFEAPSVPPLGSSQLVVNELVLDPESDLQPFIFRQLRKGFRLVDVAPEQIQGELMQTQTLARSGQSRKKKKNQKAKEPEADDPVRDALGHLDPNRSPDTLQHAISAHNLHQTLPPPYTSFVPSGWHPPPPQRCLAGDLVYLDIELRDGRVISVTGSVKGFYVNCCDGRKKFNPRKSEAYPIVYHTLIGLLCDVDPVARSVYMFHMRTRTHMNTLEGSTVLPLPHHRSWVAPLSNRVHQWKHDSLRAILHSRSALPLAEERLSVRDWNEEMQLVTRHPRNSPSEIMHIDRLMTKFYGEFALDAVEAAVRAVDGGLVPDNPNEPPNEHLFTNNGIFYSFATQVAGETKTAREVELHTKSDLLGARRLRAIPMGKLNLTATVIVDYKGSRVVCQSSISSLINQEAPIGEEPSQRYCHGGDKDEGTFVFDQEIHDAMEPLAKHLYIRSHKVKTKEGEVVDVALSAAVKGVRCHDTLYLMDLVSLTPRDTNFLDRKMAVFREELVTSFNTERARARYNQLISERLSKQVAKLKEKEHQAADRAAIAGKSGEEAGEGEGAGEEPTPPRPEGESGEGEGGEEEAMPELDLEPTLFNPDLNNGFESGDSEEERKQDEENVQLLAEFLEERCKTLKASLTESIQSSTVTDCLVLHTTFHEMGVNMRYLGKIAEMCTDERSVPTRNMLTKDMITRAIKHQFREELRRLNREQPDAVGEGVAAFLNRVLGPSKDRDEFRKRVQKEASEAFRFDVPDPSAWWGMFSQLSLLRSVCLSVGVKVHLRRFDFDAQNPIRMEDIDGMEPIMHLAEPMSAMATQLLEKATRLYSMGEFQQAAMMTQRALQATSDTYGPLCPNVVRCFAMLASIYSNLELLPVAMDAQAKALAISRRVFGWDHPSSVQQQVALAHLLQAQENHEAATHHFKWVHFLNSLSCGNPEYPETSIYLMHIGISSQAFLDPPQFIPIMKQGIDNAQKYASTHNQTGICAHMLSNAYHQQRQPTLALPYQQMAASIFPKAFSQEGQRKPIAPQAQTQTRRSGQPRASHAPDRDWVNTLYQMGRQHASTQPNGKAGRPVAAAAAAPSAAPTPAAASGEPPAAAPAAPASSDAGAPAAAGAKPKEKSKGKGKKGKGKGK